MFEPLSRRALFPSIGAVVTVAAFGVSDRATGATTVNVDSEASDGALLALGHEWQASAEDCDRLDAVFDRIADSFVYPEPPEAVFRQRADWHSFFGRYGHRHRTGRWWYGYSEAIKHLREMSCMVTDDVRERVNERKMARRDEIVNAYDAWQAQTKAAEDACGLTEASRAMNAAHDLNRQLRRRIVETPAKTLEGALLKLAVARWCNRDFDELLAENLESSGPTDVTMIYAAMIDLMNVTALRWSA
jgi:hypothetical protein